MTSKINGNQGKLPQEIATMVFDELVRPLQAHSIYTKEEIYVILNAWYLRQNLDIYRKIGKK